MDRRKLNMMLRLLAVAFYALIGNGLSYAQQSQNSENGIGGTDRFILNPGFFYRNDARELSDKSTVDIQYFDINFGYQFKGYWYLGLMYNFEQERVVADNFPLDGQNTRSEHTRTNYGLSGGIIYGSWYTRIHYLFNSEWQIAENSDTVTYNGGWGGQWDVGLNFELFEKFLLGPRISYKYLNYPRRKDSSGTNTLDKSLTKTSLDPYFVVWWEF